MRIVTNNQPTHSNGPGQRQTSPYTNNTNHFDMEKGMKMSHASTGKDEAKEEGRKKIKLRRVGKNK